MHWLILVSILLPAFFWIRHVIKQKGRPCGYVDTEARDAVTVISVIAFVMFAAFWVGLYYDSCVFVDKFESVRDTVTNARQDLNPQDKELEGVTRMIIEENKALASEKYCNQNWFMHLATTDKVDKLEPIR